MPQKSRDLRYTKAVVICHGKSELILTKHIYTNLHLPIKTHTRDNGNTSIQITSLLKELNKDFFREIDKFADKFSVEIVGRGSKKRLKNFKLYIIMDTDDCTIKQKNDYISKKMFKSLWLYDYIVPIYNNSKLEQVFEKAGIVKNVKDDEKESTYSTLFPINHNALSPATRETISALKCKLERIPETNMDTMIDYFLNLLL